ncbi:hypothetical protein TFLX_01529 [Thermoflexales bacterium]|nr:hypothetical protein TFLX_01529 [Thermoflexales bacterium]
MKRTRWLIGLLLGLGLAFVGLGHYFTAIQRSLYPLDGFFFYAVAALCFIFAWRTSRREKNAVWAALLDLWRGEWQEIRQALYDAARALQRALPYISLRLIVIVVLGLNICAAIVALWLPALTWLWGAAWGLAIIVLGVSLWPRSIFQRSTVAVAPQAAQVYVEPAIDSGARLSPIGLVSAIGLLLLGQLLLISAGQSASGSSPLAQSLEEAFQLRLTGDGSLIWPGILALISGTGLFAFVTRRSVLSDYPPLSIVEGGSSGQRGWWLLFVAAVGIALWLFAIKGLADSGTSPVEVWPWLIALMVLGACWWQIDRMRGVRLALHLERREGLWLSAALLAIFVVLAFQIGQIPNSLWGDEGAFFTNARDVTQGAALEVFGLGTYAEPGFTTIFQSWFISLLGPNVSAWRLSSVIAVWLAALPLYFLVRATLGRRTAWIALTFYAVSPYVLTYARMGYNAAQAIWPVVLALALTWLAVRRDSRFYAFLAGGAAGLSFFTPAAARMVIVLVPLWWVWITRRISAQTIGRQLAAGALGIVVVATPPIVYNLSHAPDAYVGKQFESSFNNVFYARDFYPEDQLFEWYGAIPAGQQQLFYAPQFYLPLIGRGVIRTALAFHLPSIVHENYLIGSLADPFGVLYLLGLAWSITRLRRSGYAIWPAWLLLGGFMAGALSAFPPRAALLLPIAPVLVTLSALGLTAGVDVLSKLMGNIPERIKTYGLVAATALLALLGLRAYFIEMPQRFPPDLDNAVFWEAQALGPGADITLIQPDGVPDNYVPWGVQQFALDMNYHLIKKADLPVTDWNGLCPSGECRFVYVSADRDSVYPYLAQVFGERTPTEIRGADGAVQAYVYAR